MVTAPNIVTDRLILRDITVQDTELIVDWRSDPEIYKYFLDPHPLDKKEHLDWYWDHYIFNLDRFDFMAVKRDTASPIGVFGIKREGCGSKEAEVSYILAPGEQGRGYASEAVTALMGYIKTEWKCQRVIAIIHKDNQTSICFIRKLGYQCVYCNEMFGTYKKEL